MKFTQKVSSFIALVLLATTFNAHKTHAMESEQSNNIDWVTLVGATILGGYMAYEQFLSYIHEKQSPTHEEGKEEEASGFSSLSIEMQYHIIALLAKVSTAKTLKEVTHIINSLAQVNHDLNDLINDPKFCMKIIKNLAQQFDCSYETAAAALQTKEAKNRLAIQKQFEQLFTALQFDEKLFNQLYKKHKSYVDLNFTYHSFKKPQDDAKDTLLITITEGNNDNNKKRKLICLLNTKLVNADYQNKKGETALMRCVRVCDDPEIVKLLTTQININLQDNTPLTALQYACLRNNNKNDFIIILLDAGADPEFTDPTELTPLDIVKHSHDRDAINLIQKAIEKKHEKK